jgi:hypothetical protein
MLFLVGGQMDMTKLLVIATFWYFFKHPKIFKKCKFSDDLIFYTFCPVHNSDLGYCVNMKYD